MKLRTLPTTLVAGTALLFSSLSCSTLLGPKCELVAEVIDQKRSADAGNANSVSVHDRWKIGLDEVESAEVVPSPGLPNLALAFSESVTERIAAASVEYRGEYLSISRTGFTPLQLQMSMSLEEVTSYNIPVASDEHGRELLEMFVTPCE